MWSLLPLIPLSLVPLACREAEPTPVGQAPYEPPTGIVGPTPVIDGEAPRNVWMITIDTLRRDHVSRYDPEERNLTPFLDELMQEGFAADAHRVCSNWTMHGLGCGLGGAWPLDRGFVPKVIPAEQLPWPEGSRFLADELRDAGFATVLATGSGFLGDRFGNVGGYDVVRGNAFDPLDTLFGYASFDLQAALNRPEPPERWFVHTHIVEPHAPFAPPDDYRLGEERLEPVPWNLDDYRAHYDATDAVDQLTDAERATLEAHLRLRYEGELRWMDDRLRAQFDDLAARGWLDDTLVVVWSDHGEQFWERGQQSHAYTLHHEENDGVFFFWAPGLQPDSTLAPTNQVDIAPTVLELLDLPVPDYMTGYPMGSVPADRPQHLAADARLGMMQSVVLGDRQLIYRWSGAAFFYQLDEDPVQATDRYNPQSTEVQQLWELLRPRIDAARPLVEEHTPVPPPGLSL